MKFFNLYLIIPFLVLGCASISAADATKKVTPPIVFDPIDPELAQKLDIIDRQLANCFEESRKSGYTNFHTCLDHHVDTLTHIRTARELSAIEAERKTREEAECKAIEEAERKAREEVERKTREEMDIDKRDREYLKRLAAALYFTCITNTPNEVAYCRTKFAESVNESLAKAAKYCDSLKP